MYHNFFNIVIVIMRITTLFSCVFSYSYNVHEFLGNILENHLIHNYPEIHYKIQTNLNGTSFAKASSWPDKVKRTKKYKWTRELHYIGINSCSMKEEDIPNNHNIYHFIEGLSSRKYNLTNEENIKFLLHSLQDVTQPLHNYGKYVGGNSYKITRNKNGRNRTMSLHSLWDKELPTYYIKNFYSEVEYTCKNTSLIDVVNFNLNLDCNYIYNISNRYLIFENYFQPSIFRALFDNYINLAINYLKKY